MRLEQRLSTRRSPWRFSKRATGPPWNLTFAEAAGQDGVGDCGRSRAPTDDCDKFAAERLISKVTNLRYRPVAVLLHGDFEPSNQSEDRANQ